MAHTCNMAALRIVLPLPPESQYVDGSWELSETDPDLIRECYNKNQKDETDKET